MKLLAVGVVLAAAGGVASDDVPGTGDVTAWVTKQVEERMPSAEERRYDEVGWVTDLRAAMQLGKEHNRPIFLFTMDGRINTGRC